MTDSVNHPSHYTDIVPGIECIDVTEHFSFLRGNAIKYLWRAGAKADVVEDLRKAAWYVQRELDGLAAPDLSADVIAELRARLVVEAREVVRLSDMWTRSRTANVELQANFEAALNELDDARGDVGRLTAERDQAREEVEVYASRVAALEAALDHAQLADIEARNPGIDMDEVRRVRAEQQSTS